MAGLSPRERWRCERFSNAVTWLLDRNIEEGRGEKLAFTDTVSQLTHRDLQKQTQTSPICCAGCGRPPRRARRHDHAR